MSPGRLDCAPDASGPSLLQGQAHARRESCRSVCVTLLFFPSCVWFFSLEPFHRNSGNKDLVFSWCSDVAGSVGWTLPPFPSPGDRFWSLEKCQILGPPAITPPPHTLPPSTPPLPSWLTLRVVSRVQRTQASCTPPQEMTSAACATCRLCLALLLSSSLPHKKPLADRQQNRVVKPGLLQKRHTVPPCIKHKASGLTTTSD